MRRGGGEGCRGSGPVGPVDSLKTSVKCECECVCV